MALSSSRRLRSNSFELDLVSGVELSGLAEKPLRTARAAFETAYARRLLARNDGNVQKAAKDAGLAVGSFYKLLRRLHLRPRDL